MLSKEKYIQFCSEHLDIPVFSQAWWLDTLAGADNWDVILVEKNDKIIASFPYVYKKGRLGLKAVEMPILTQKLGPYIVYDKNKLSESKRISYEHEVYNQIIEQLPKYDRLSINFDWKYKNWLPFYWHGFSQTTCYTYRVNDIKNHEQVLSSFARSKKPGVKKGSEYLILRFDLDRDVFYDYFQDVVNERGNDVGYSRLQFKELCKCLYEHHQGRIFYCTDNNGNIHAINLTAWDNESAYYLIAMRKKEFNTSGGTEFLVYETIKYVSQFVDCFDFEGSMMQGVEESYRYYGSKQTEYYSISKINNKLLKLYRALRS
jgi:hypothetical protein